VRYGRSATKNEKRGKEFKDLRAEAKRGLRLRRKEKIVRMRKRAPKRASTQPGFDTRRVRYGSKRKGKTAFARSS